MGMAPSDVCGSKPDGFYHLCTGFIGLEASISFVEYIAKYQNVVTAKDVLDNKVDAKRAGKLGASEALAVIERLVQHAAENKWTLTDAQRSCAFCKTRSEEQLLHFFNKMMACGNLPNVQLVSSIISKDIVEVVQKSRSLQTPDKK